MYYCMYSHSARLCRTMYVLQCKAINLYVRSCKSLGQYVLLYVLVMYNAVRLCITVDDLCVGLRMVCYTDSRLPNASHFGVVSFSLVFSFCDFFSDLDHWGQMLHGILYSDYFSSMLLLYCSFIDCCCYWCWFSLGTGKVGGIEVCQMIMGDRGMPDDYGGIEVYQMIMGG